MTLVLKKEVHLGSSVPRLYATTPQSSLILCEIHLSLYHDLGK